VALAADEGLELIVPEALVKYMKRRGHTVRSLAEVTGVHRCTIGRLRAGTQNTARVEHAEAIAEELQVPLVRLFAVPEASRVADDCVIRETLAGGEEVPAA
jgi:transcriptional regulator with XRE-family HTH domain